MSRDLASVCGIVLLAAAASAQDDPVTVELRPQPGEVVLTRSHRLVQTLTVGGELLTTNSESTTTLRVVTQPSETTEQILRTYTPLRTRSTLVFPGGSTLRFDSANPEATTVPGVPEGDQVLADLQLASKLTRTEVFDSGHRLLRVEVAGDGINRLTPELRRRWSPDYLQRTYTERAALLPPRPVAAGEQWTADSRLDLGRGQVLKLKTRCVYRGRTQDAGREIDVIGTQITAAELTMPERQPVRVMDSQLQPMRSTGELRIDVQSGLLLANRFRLQVTGPVKLAASDTTLEGRVNLTIMTREELSSEP